MDSDGRARRSEAVNEGLASFYGRRQAFLTDLESGVHLCVSAASCSPLKFRVIAFISMLARTGAACSLKKPQTVRTDPDPMN